MPAAVLKRTSPRRRWRPRRDYVRGVALALCVIFALIGTVPLSLGLLVRTAPVRTWAARETAAALARELGVGARYEVEVQAWPLMIGLRHVVVEASDGGSPFLEVERAAVRPRIFSLLAGEVDVGDVEVIGPRIRAVVAGGEILNLRYRLPKSSGGGGDGPRSSVSSVSITDARIDATIDGVRIDTREVDVDVSAEEGDAFEISMRAGMTQIRRAHAIPGREGVEDAVDDDVVCRLDGRVRVEPGEVLVRRLTLAGSADFDPDPGTTPRCDLPEGDWRSFDVRLGAVRVAKRSDGPPALSGRIHARLPVPLAHRFADLPHATGSVELDVEAEYDGRSRLPRLTGRVKAQRPGVDGKVFADHLELEVGIASDVVHVSHLEAAWADGTVTIAEAKIEPFAPGLPLTVSDVQLTGLEFPGLLRDLGVHPRTHVAWSLREGKLEHFKGTLDPVALEGPLSVTTRGFEIFDRPTAEPARAHMFGVKEGTVRGTFMVRPAGVVLSNFSVDTPKSHVRTTVAIGFKSTIDLEVAEGSTIDLAECSPLTAIPVAGTASIKAQVHGGFDRPKLTGELSIKDFVFGGFPVGDVEQAKAEFEPLVLALSEVRVKHGASRARASSVRVDFDTADVVVDADLDTREAPHLAVRDFFEVFHFDKDPRFADISGVAKGTARVHYALGGTEDRCGGGALDVRADMAFDRVSLFGERYDSGSLDLDFRWDDQAAGDAGMAVDIHAAELRKGSGSVLASGSIAHGAVVRMGAIATGIPIGRLDAFGPAGKLFDGSVSMVSNVTGTLGALEMVSDVQVSRVRIGSAALPASRFSVVLEPGPAPKVLGTTRCGNPRTAPFDKAEYDKDLVAGVFRMNGKLFDGQIALDDVRFTRQRHKVVSGRVGVTKLDLGKLSNLVPALAFSATPPAGALSATFDVKRLPLDDPKRSEVTATISELEVTRAGRRVRLTEPSGPIVLANDDLTIPDLRLEAKMKSGLTGVLVAGGSARHVTTAPDLDMGVRVEPLELSRLSADIREVERAGGTIDANLRIAGPASAPRYSGSAHVRKGELDLRGSPLSLDGINIDVEVGNGEVRVTRAVASVGTGTISITGRMPVHGLDLGTAQGSIVLRGVKVPVAEGVNLTADADLQASYRPGGAEGQGLPELKGTVSLTSFSYTRPIAMSVNLGQLAGRAQRTTVEAYDPDDDFVRFNLVVVSPRPLRFSNNLVDMQLTVADPGITLSGTNQRFGARGMLKILPDSKLQLRSTEFDVREGYVRFDDPARIAPKVDVTATTEYHRYAGSQADSAAAGAEGAAAGAAGGGASTSGQWRINLHAHGDAEDLKVNLTSDPPLGQEDIVLLLTFGMTRAEIDRGLASSLGETVGLEALTSLTGADKAVKTVVPLIDEFRFGTGYSSRTGRTEPTVTVGKKITGDVRANVTTGVTENREVRSSVEWRLNRRVSVQGSYDNANDVSSSALGNVGADLRWRLEFE